LHKHKTTKPRFGCLLQHPASNPQPARANVILPRL